MSHPPLDCPPFQPATVRKCIKTTVRVQNIDKPQEVIILTSVISSVESILSVDPDAPSNSNGYTMDHGGGEEEESDSDFTDSYDFSDDDDSSISSDEGDGNDQDCPMKSVERMADESENGPPPQDNNSSNEGSRNGSNHGYRMKAFFKEREPLCENHHGLYATYIYRAKVLQKADYDWVDTGELVAIKEVSWRTIRASRQRMSEDFVKEIAALQYISDWHNNEMGGIRTIFDTHVLAADTIMSNESHLYIVMPYCAGGDLFQLVAEREDTRLTEEESKFWFRQILRGLEALQLMKLCHKDLSPENFIILDNVSLVIDFGMCLRIPYSAEVRHLISPRTACGKLPFVAPEIFRQCPFDGHAVDIWAAGTILLFLLTGKRLPNPLYAEIMLRSNDLGVSQEALDLLQRMLRLDPNRRLSLQQIQSHSWVQYHEYFPPR